MKLTWFWQATIAMLLLVPAWIGIAMVSRTSNVRGEVAAFLYMFGLVIGTFVFLTSRSTPIFSGGRSMWILLALGMIVGAAANMFLFRAVVSAPNAGLPVAIANAGSVLLFLVTFLIARFAPSLVPVQTFQWPQLVGILLTVIGVGLIALRP